MKQLQGPYELSIECIDRTLPPGLPGVFALGYVDASGTFRIQSVGRDDDDLRRRLRDMVGSSNRFKYASASDSQEAFEHECELFHRFTPRGNVMHPQRPPGAKWKCPRCFQLHFS